MRELEYRCVVCFCVRIDVRIWYRHLVLYPMCFSLYVIKLINAFYIHCRKITLMHFKNWNSAAMYEFLFKCAYKGYIIYMILFYCMFSFFYWALQLSTIECSVHHSLSYCIARVSFSSSLCFCERKYYWKYHFDIFSF